MNTYSFIHSRGNLVHGSGMSHAIGMVFAAIKVRVFTLFHRPVNADLAKAAELRHLASLQANGNTSYAADLMAAASQCEQSARDQMSTKVIAQ